MPLRRVHLGSLLVIALALAGATVAPTRDYGRHAVAVSWRADEVRRAPVTAKAQRRQSIGLTTSPQPSPSISRSAPQGPVRHSLFQRPPPASSNTR